MIFFLSGGRTNLPQGVDTCHIRKTSTTVHVSRLKETGPYNLIILPYNQLPTLGKGKVISQMRVSFHSRLCNLHNLNIQNLNILLRLLLINPRILNFMNNIQDPESPSQKSYAYYQAKATTYLSAFIPTHQNQREIRELTVFSVVIKN